jgi:hypothetical protein
MTFENVVRAVASQQPLRIMPKNGEALGGTDERAGE